MNKKTISEEMDVDKPAVKSENQMEVDKPRKALHYKRTALAPAIEVFERFINELLSVEKA
jgi:hypothetical protein